jgi:F-box and WD-40 domain protein CDC4
MATEEKVNNLVFKVHGDGAITSLLLQDGKIAISSDDRTACIFDAKTGELIHRLNLHSGGVWALAMAGGFIITASTDKTAMVWDLETGECLHNFPGHSSTVRAIKVVTLPGATGEPESSEENNSVVITASRDTTMRVWRLPKKGDPSTWRESSGPVAESPYFLRTLRGHNHTVRCIDAYGDSLVSGSYDKTVRAWKVSTGELLHTFTDHAEKIYAVVLDHKRNRCISGSMDSTIKVWCLASGACLFTLEGHTRLVGLLSLSVENLVSASADGTIRVWNPENGEHKTTITLNDDAITCIWHDATYIISGSATGVRLWDTKTGEFKKDLITDITCARSLGASDGTCAAGVIRNAASYIEVSSCTVLILFLQCLTI